MRGVNKIEFITGADRGEQHIHIRRIDTLNHSSILRFHELVVYEETNGLVIFTAIGRGELNDEVRHRYYRGCLFQQTLKSIRKVGIIN